MSRLCGFADTTTGWPCENIVEDFSDHCAAGHPNWAYRPAVLVPRTDLSAAVSSMGIDDLFGACPSPKRSTVKQSAFVRKSTQIRKKEVFREKTASSDPLERTATLRRASFGRGFLAETQGRPKKPTAAQVEALEARLKKRIITVDMDGTAYDPWACCGKADMSHVGTDKCRHMRQDVIDEVRALAQKTNASVVVLSWRGGDKGTRKWLEHVGFEVDAVFIPESEDNIVGYAPEVKGSKKKPIGAQAGFKLSTLQSLRALGHNVIASFDNQVLICEELRKFGVRNVRQVAHIAHPKHYEYIAGWIGAPEQLEFDLRLDATAPGQR